MRICEALAKGDVEQAARSIAIGLAMKVVASAVCVIS
jgi:hypothetical protein